MLKETENQISTPWYGSLTAQLILLAVAAAALIWLAAKYVW